MSELVRFSQVQTRETRRTFTQAAWRRAGTEGAESPAGGAGVAATRPDLPPPPRITGTFHQNQSY